MCSIIKQFGLNEEFPGEQLEETFTWGWPKLRTFDNDYETFKNSYKMLEYHCKSIHSLWRTFKLGTIFTANNCENWGSPGLVVMEGDSRSKGCGFKSRHCILDGHFFTYICCKNCHVRLKRPKLTKKRPGLALFKKKNQIKFYLVSGTELQFSNLMSLLIWTGL